MCKDCLKREEMLNELLAIKPILYQIHIDLDNINTALNRFFEIVNEDDILDKKPKSGCVVFSDHPNPVPEPPKAIPQNETTHYCIQHACPTNNEIECEASFYRPDGVIGDCSIVKIRSDR